MTIQPSWNWVTKFGFALVSLLTASAAFAAMGGIDHLPDYLSVSDFSVNGAEGFQAGNGNAGVPGPTLPEKWHRGLTVHVKWYVSDWKYNTGSGSHEADVPVEPYTEMGTVWVHFLADGTVRVVVSNYGPRSPDYPGPHDSIPQKRPWTMYPPRIDYRDLSERLVDYDIDKRRCATAADPKACEDKADKKSLDEQQSDARRYLPPCASVQGDAYDTCQRSAEQQMRTARLLRRCKSAPDLPDCAPGVPAFQPMQSTPTEGPEK